MTPKKICFGFDGICADMSFFIEDLPKYQADLLIKYPWLRPIFDLLIQKGEDCELQFESTNFGFETFSDCIFKLTEISQKQTTHVGANSAIETVTASNLLKDLVYPIDAAKVYFLGNYSNDVFQEFGEGGFFRTNHFQWVSNPNNGGEMKRLSNLREVWRPQVYYRLEF